MPGMSHSSRQSGMVFRTREERLLHVRNETEVYKGRQETDGRFSCRSLKFRAFLGRSSVL
jgi:hypothetical protein